MAATKSQGVKVTLFMFGLTAVTAGIAFFSSGMAKVALVIGSIAVLFSLWGFFKTKLDEGKVALGAQPAILKLAGVAVVVIGWMVVLFGLHLTSSVGGRMVTSIVGLAISLAGICYILAPAVSKNAIWKA